MALAPVERREFEEALAKIPSGYSEGFFGDRRYGVTLARSDDGKRSTLFARQLERESGTFYHGLIAAKARVILFCGLCRVDKRRCRLFFRRSGVC
jgi:hypothetical protein